MTATARRVGTVVGPQGIPGRNGSVGAPGPPGTPGASGTSAILPSFTVPAVGSSVIVTPTSGTSALVKGCGVNITTAGSYTITANTGTMVTLVNNLPAADGNAAPTTVITSGQVATVTSSVAPFGAVPPGAGQTHILLDGVWTPTGVLNCFTDRFFGVEADGTTDDTVALQAALTYMTTHRGILYSDVGIRVISSQLNINLPPSQGFRWIGAGGVAQPFSTVIKWNGSLSPMCVLTGGQGFHMEHIAWQGNAFQSNQTTVCFQLLPIVGNGSFAHKFEHCTFSAISGNNTIKYRLNNHAYSSTAGGGDIIAGPDSGLGYAARGLQSDNGHIYKCTTGGTTATAPTLPTYDTTSGSFTTDGTAVFQEIGISPCGFLMGDSYSNSSLEVSEISLGDCIFSGFSGFRVVNGSNVKNLQFTGRTEAANSGIGLDLRAFNGTCPIDFLIGSINTEADIRLGGGHVVVNGMESEGSARMLTGGTKWASCTINAFEWDGAPPNDQGHFIPIDVETNLRLCGGHILSGSPGQPVEIRAAFLSKQSGDATCSLDLKQVVCHFTPAPVILDSNTFNYLGGPVNIQGYLAHQLNLTIDNCLGDTDGTVATSSPWQNVRGRDLYVTRQQISQKASNSEVTCTVYTSYGATGERNPIMHMNVNFASLTAAASSQTFRIGAPFDKMKIIDARADVLIGFPTIGTPTIEMGTIIPIGGTAVTNSILTAASIATATGANVIGKETGNLALTWPGLMIWGADYDGTTGTQSYLTITVRAGSGFVNAATAGSVDLYVEFENWPGNQL